MECSQKHGNCFYKWSRFSYNSWGTNSISYASCVRMYWLWFYFIFLWLWKSIIPISALFEYGDFICCNSKEAPGTLADIESESALLSFFRLVGCTYFRKHKPVFLPSYPMPATIFNSLYKDHQTSLTHHRIWLQFIRERVWSRWRRNDTISWCIRETLETIMLGASNMEASKQK